MLESANAAFFHVLPAGVAPGRLVAGVEAASSSRLAVGGSRPSTEFPCKNSVASSKALLKS